MSESSRVIVGATVGAFVGAAVAYLFLTEDGREIRDTLGPTVEDLTREFGKLRVTVERIGDVASDGIRAFEEFQYARAEHRSPVVPEPEPAATGQSLR